MKSGKKLAEELFQPLIGMESRIRLGHGSFLTLDFGKEIIEEVTTRNSKKTFVFGEWHVWIYMCNWRIDCYDNGLIGSGDDRDSIQQKLSEWQDVILRGFSVINSSFDAVLEFDQGYAIRLFSHKTIGNIQWKLFTPQNYTFIAGPGDEWSYRSSDS